MLRNIKIAVTCALLLCLIFALSGCDQLHFIFSDTGESVVRIELIYYNNPEARSNPRESLPLDLEKLELLEVLVNEEIENFIAELRQIDAIGGLYRDVLFSHDGIGIKITYDNGNLEIITLTTLDDGRQQFFTGIYDNEGNTLRSWNTLGVTTFVDQFNDLLDNYFER